MTGLTGEHFALNVDQVIQGIVRLDEFDRVLTEHDYRTRDDFASAVESYCRTIWLKTPERAREVAWALWDSGRIHYRYADDADERSAPGP